MVTIAVNRVTGFTGAVLVTLLTADVAPGLSAPAVTIPAGSTTAEVTISATAAVTLGIKQVEFLGTPIGTSEWEAAELLFSVNVTAPGTFTMTLGGFSNLSYPGQTFHATVTLSRNQLVQPITIGIAPLGGFTFAVTQPGTGNTADIAVTVGNSVPIRSFFSIRVTASSPPAPDQLGVIETTVYPPSFTMTVLPAALSISQGGVAGVTITATRDPGNVAAITITGSGSHGSITAAPATLTNQPVTLQVAVGTDVPVGAYTLRIYGAQADPDAPGHEVVIPVTVTSGSFTLTPQVTPLNLSVGTPQAETITINRGAFSSPVSIAATTDDPHLTVTPNPSPPASGNQVTLTVDAGSAVRAGAHTVTLTGSSGLVTATGSFVVNVSLPPGGAPTGIVIVPLPTPNAPTTTKGSIVQYTAYLVDAAGNRTLPAAGWNIGFATGTSAVATVQLPLPDYDTTQRWRTASIGAGQTAGTSSVTAFYFNTTTGTSTFVAGSTLTVTP